MDGADIYNRDVKDERKPEPQALDEHDRRVEPIAEIEPEREPEPDLEPHRLSPMWKRNGGGEHS